MSDRKEIEVDLPTMSISCPNCGHEDDHSGAIFTPSEGSFIFATGETYCDKCGQWFNVILK